MSTTDHPLATADRRAPDAPVLDQWVADGAHYRIVDAAIPCVELFGERVDLGPGTLALVHLPLGAIYGAWHPAEIRGSDAEAVASRLAALAKQLRPTADAIQRTHYDRVAEAIGWLEIAVQQGGKLGGKRREVERALGYLRDHQESKGGAA